MQKRGDIFSQKKNLNFYICLCHLLAVKCWTNIFSSLEFICLKVRTLNELKKKKKVKFLFTPIIAHLKWHESHLTNSNSLFSFFFCFIKLLSPAINKCHMALEVSHLSMWQKEFPQKKEIMLTPEHDCNDNRERGQIGPACAPPPWVCVPRWNSKNKPFLSNA